MKAQPINSPEDSCAFADVLGQVFDRPRDAAIRIDAKSVLPLYFEKVGDLVENGFQALVGHDFESNPPMTCAKDPSRSR